MFLLTRSSIKLSLIGRTCTRENHQQKDLNRLFKNEKPPLEVSFAQSILDSKFDLTLELHEDDESNGYYLYQKETNSKYQQLGIEIINAIQEIMPINTDNEIDGSTAHQGVINNDLDLSKMDWWPMALYGISRGAQISLTLHFVYLNLLAHPYFLPK